MPRTLTFLALCAVTLASWANDEETRFKPKSYTPRQTLRENSYRESAYTPSASPQTTGKRVEAPSAPSRWRLFGFNKKIDDVKKLADAPVERETAYKQEKQISVSTLKADPRDVPEHKPFTDDGKKLTDGDYKAKEAPREKNPLLAPRQGIKAPE